MTENIRQAWGFSPFCDDIRSELGGKMSVMGIYQADMLFPSHVEYPIVVAKFCIVVKYYEFKDAFTDDITVRVFLPGEPKNAPSVQIPIKRQELVVPPHPYELEEDQERLTALTFPIMITPLAVKQEGFVKVRAACGDFVANLGSLMIRKLRTDESFPGIPAGVPGPVISG